MASWLEDALASIAASGEVGTGMAAPQKTARERELEAALAGVSGSAPFSLAGDPMTAGGDVPNGPGLPAARNPLGPAGSYPISAGPDLSQMAGAPAFPVSPFGVVSQAAPGPPPQMEAQPAIPGLNSPMGGAAGGGAPFSIAGSPSLVAAKEMTAPPPMAPQAPVANLVPPGAAPGSPALAAPPVAAQDDEDAPAKPTDVSARSRAPAAVAMPAPAAAVAPPSIMDRIRGISPDLIALGAGLSGHGWGASQELAAGRAKKEETQALQLQQGNVTARLLASKGATPQEVAAAISGGPEVMKALIGQYFSKDKFAVTQTGEVEDAYGGKRKVFKIFNSNDGTFKDVPADTAAEAKAIAGGEAPELNEPQKNRVRAIIDGREPYPATSRAPDAAKIRAGVHAEDPNFDAINYKSRETTRKNFTSGKAAGNVTAFNTAIGHLGTLYDSVDGLGNRGSPWYNRLTQPISENLDTKYATNLKKFEAARTAVADELTRAFRGSGGNVHDIIQWEKTMSTADSPQALKGAVQQAAELLNSRIVSLGDEYNRGMGTTKDPLELLNPKAAKAFQHLLEGGRAPASAAPVKPGNYVWKNGTLVPE